MFSTAIYIYKSHLLDLCKPKRLITWAAASTGMLILCALILQVRGAETGDSYAYTKLYEQMLVRFIAFCSAVISCSVISAEIEQRTVVYMLTRSFPRSIHILMRSLASHTFVVFVGAFLLLGTSVLVWKTGPLANPFFFRDLVGIVLGAFAYGSLFVVVSLLLNRALMYCLLFCFGWETLVPNMPGDIYYASILSHVKGFVNHPIPSTPFGQSVIGRVQGAFQDTYLINPNTALMSLIGCAIVLSLFAMWHFSRNEYTAREDAE